MTFNLRHSVLALAVLAAAWGGLFAGSIRVRWEPVEGAIAYEVAYGPTPGTITGRVATASGTVAELPGLDDCRNWHVAVRALHPQGWSAFSAPIVGWTRPRTDHFTPREARQGETVTLRLHGGSFRPGASFRLRSPDLPRGTDDEPLVRLVNASVGECGRADVLLEVDGARGMRAAPTGTLSAYLEVRNPDGTFSLRSFPLEILFDPDRRDINRSTDETRDRVDGSDLIWLTFAYGNAADDPRYNPDADLDGDGWIDGRDLALLSAGFGTCRSGSGWSEQACVARQF